MLGNFLCFCCCLLTFLKFTFSNNSFRNAVRVLNGLDPDQNQCSVAPDLGPKLFVKVISRQQELSAARKNLK